MDNEETIANSPSIRIAKRAGISDDLLHTVKNVTRGANAVSPYHLPWFPTLAAGSAVAGGLLGYKGADALLSKMRDAAAKAEIAKAQKEYEEALFGTRPGLKLADEVGTLAASLQKIVPVMQKVANAKSLLSPQSERVASTLLGLYALLAAGGTAAGAYHGFKAQRGKSDAMAIRRAQKERQLVETRPVSHVPVIVGQEALH